MTTAPASDPTNCPVPASGGGVSIALRDVSRRFPGGVSAIERMSLDVPQGQFLSLIGPSGCGKSTLLRLIAGLDEPSEGSIEVRSSIDIAYVFQDAHLLPWRNVLRNVALPLELRGIGNPQRDRAARDAIAAVGLTDFARGYPAQLSGGMRMRASLARALVTKPKLLLLDEPFAALDEITRQQLDDQLRRLWLEHRMTVLFVTHSLVEAVFLAERAIVLSRRPARIVLDHTIELPSDRAGPIRGTPQFAAQMRLLFEALERGGGA